MSAGLLRVMCAGVAVLLLPRWAHPATAQPPPGDPKRGAQVAQACVACHGPGGEGMPAQGFPRLAGQNAQYLDKQLGDYISGARTSPVMTALAKTLDAQQRADVAAHFAGLKTPRAAASAKDESATILRGQLLARTGDESKQLQACANCHGPDGIGEAYATPYLAGQGSAYLRSAIGEWKSGARKNDGGQQMAVVAARLDDRDISAISAYFESLAPPTFAPLAAKRK